MSGVMIYHADMFNLECMMIEIEKGIPLPSKPVTREGGCKPKYPFQAMEVGDSFEVKAPPKSFVNIVAVYGKKLGVKFTTRKTEGGRRVWRVA